MSIPISSFVRVGNGKWRCVKSGDLVGSAGRRVQVHAGMEFTIGGNYMGVDVALELEKAEDGDRKAARPLPSGG